MVKHLIFHLYPFILSIPLYVSLLVGAGGVDVAAISDLLAGFAPSTGGALAAPASQGQSNGLLEGTPGKLHVVSFSPGLYELHISLTNKKSCF